MPYTGIPLTLEKKASGEESEVSQPVSLTYLNRWKAFYQGKIIITVIIITIMKKKRETIVKYQWYSDLGGITFNSHFKTGRCLSTVNKNRKLYINISLYLLVFCHRVARCATVPSNQKPVFIWSISYLKNGIFSKSDISFKIFQVNSQRQVTSGCNAMEVVISKPKFTAWIPKPKLVVRPSTIEIDWAIHTSLKNGPTASISGHVTADCDWLISIRINAVHTSGIITTLKNLKAAFWL